MKTTSRRTLLVGICCMCSIVLHAEEPEEPNDFGNDKEMGVSIELTKFEVSGLTLSLDYTIRNSSGHDVWVCTEVSATPFEVYVMADKQTLLIRKRLEVPTRTIWHRPPPPATYVRVVSGDERAESLLIDLPVSPKVIYASEGAQVGLTARRVAVEIGYYDRDLPALIRGILAVMGKFSGESIDFAPDVLRTYFRGFAVASVLLRFDELQKDPYGEGRVYIPYSHQALAEDEKVLRMEISGVAIPYKGRIEADIVPGE